MEPLERVLEALEVARGPDESGERWAFCPAHDDRRTPNLHVREAQDGGVLLHCFAGCSQDEVLAALEERGVRRRDLFPQGGYAGEVGGRGVSLPPGARATLQPRPEKGEETRDEGLHDPPRPPATPLQPCTLEAYAEAKKLPVEFLRKLGLSDFRYTGAPAIRIPYRDAAGVEVAVRFRTSLSKSEDGADDRFRWRRGSKAMPYGL